MHNLRSALDLLACDLAQIAEKPPRNVRFPFWTDNNDHSDVREMLKRSNIARAGRHVVDFIKSEIKPFPQGNPLLRAIHDLDIADKHAVILPVAHASEVRSIFGSIMVANVGCDMLIDGPRNLAFERSINGTYDVVLTGQKLLDTTSVVDALHDMAKLVAGVVDALERVSGRDAQAVG